MTHTILAFDGFETRGGKAIPAGAFSASVLQHFYSDYSLLWAPAGAGNSKIYAVTFLSADGTVSASVGGTYTWGSWHFYIDTLPGAGQYAMFCGMNDFTHTHSGCRIKADGSVSVWNGAAWSADSVGKLVAGRWYQMSYHNIALNGSEVRLIVRDVNTLSEVANIAGVIDSNDALSFFFFGGSTGSGASANNYGVYHYDNFVWEGAQAAASVDDPFLILGCSYAEWILPILGTGTDNDPVWSGSYADVDEVPNDGDTSYRYIVYSDGKFTSTTTDPTVAQPLYKIATVPAVMAQTMGKRTAGSGSGTKVRLRRGATVSESSAWAGTVYTWQLKLWALDPTDGAAWTESRVIELEVGATSDGAGAGANRTTCTHLTILVTIQTLSAVAQRILDYTLDVNEDGQPIRDQAGEIVAPEDVMPNTWIAIVGWRTPDAEAYSDYMDNPEMMPVISRKFTAPDDLSLTSGTDDLPEVMIARLTQRSTA